MRDKPDVTLMALVVGMFISILICISVMGYFAFNIGNVDYKYEVMQQDYTRRIEMQNRDNDIRINRLQEQITTMQFTTEKRMRLLDEQLQQYRNEKQR